MQNFYDWYGALEPLLRTYWTIALITSFVFAIQMVLTFVGLGDGDIDMDAPADFSGDGDTLDVGGAMQIFTFRNFINFLLGFGWAGVCLWDCFESTAITMVVALLIGVLFVLVFVLVYKQLFKLQSNGAFRINDALGKTVDVYLRIPAGRTGQGKVQVSFGGSVQELTAVTDGEAIPSGSKVLITEILSKDTVLVISNS